MSFFYYVHVYNVPVVRETSRSEKFVSWCKMFGISERLLVWVKFRSWSQVITEQSIKKLIWSMGNKAPTVLKEMKSKYSNIMYYALTTFCPSVHVPELQDILLSFLNWLYYKFFSDLKPLNDATSCQCKMLDMLWLSSLSISRWQLIIQPITLWSTKLSEYMAEKDFLLRLTSNTLKVSTMYTIVFHIVVEATFSDGYAEPWNM